MEVHIRVPSALRDLIGGRSGIDVHLPDRATVGDLLDVVAVDHPALERRVRDEQGVRRTHVNLFVGEADVRTLAGEATVLSPGDEVDHPGSDLRRMSASPGPESTSHSDRDRAAGPLDGRRSSGVVR